MYCGYTLQEDGPKAEHPEGRHSGGQSTSILCVSGSNALLQSNNPSVNI